MRTGREAGSAITSLSLPPADAGQLVTALDRDLWVRAPSCASCRAMAWPSRVSSPSSAAVVGLDWRMLGTMRMRMTGPSWTDLEFTDVRVAGEQGEVQGVDGDLTAAAGGKGEHVIVSTMDCFSAGRVCARMGTGLGRR